MLKTKKQNQTVKVVAMTSFYLSGRVVNAGEVIEPNMEELADVQNKVRPYKKQEVKEVKTTSTRKTTTRKAD